ncbi:retrovirus-related pol polyprotein from transposon TNT 1-94 [Tanacetum coccineum]
MAQENYVEGCSMKIPPLLEPNGFCFSKSLFKTYVKSKDIVLWQVIQNSDLYFEVEDEETKLMKETPYELLKDTEKKQLGKNEEAKMTIYNALPHKSMSEYSCVKPPRSLKSLDPDYSSKNHVRKFLCALPLKWRAKVTAIEQAKDLATLPLDELIGNLKVYEMVLDNDGVAPKTTKEKVKSLALKAKVTRNETSDDNDSQDGSDAEVDEEEPKHSTFWLGTSVSSFARATGLDAVIDLVIALETKAVKLKAKGSMLQLRNRIEDGDAQRNDETCLMAINSQEVVSKPSSSNINLNIIDLQKENEELLKFTKDFTKTFEKILKEKRALEDKNSKLSCKINDLELEVKKLATNKEIVDSGCTKHMPGNRRVLFTSYKAYDGVHVVFRSNLKHKVIGRVNFTKEDCAISKNGKTLAKGHRRNGLYTCKLGDNSKQQIFLASVVDNSTLWHRMLGHDNMRLVQNLASNKLVRNLPKLSFERHFCDTCGLESQGNANNRTRNEVSTTKVLELLHLDLVGPSPIQSYGGNFYTLIIVDDYSNYTWVVFVDSKDDVLEKFKILCKKLENLHDCSSVSIVTNHSSEFDKLQFGSFCEQHGKSYNLLGLFTSQPIHLTKFDPKSYEGVFLGYPQTSKAYIVLNKETMKIEESLNVTFDESFPKPKSSSSVKDDRIDEPIVQDLNGSPSLQVNVSDEGYPTSLKKARGHPIEQVIGELNERTLRSKSKQA